MPWRQHQHHYLLLPPPLHLLPGPRQRLVREPGRVPALERPQEAEQLRRGRGGVLSAPRSRTGGGAVWQRPSSLLGFWSSGRGRGPGPALWLWFMSLRSRGREGFFVPSCPPRAGGEGSDGSDPVGISFHVSSLRVDYS